MRVIHDTSHDRLYAGIVAVGATCDGKAKGRSRSEVTQGIPRRRQHGIAGRLMPGYTKPGKGGQGHAPSVSWHGPVSRRAVSVARRPFTAGGGEHGRVPERKTASARSL